MLGGAGVVGNLQSRIEIVEAVRSGFPYGAFEALVEAMAVGTKVLAGILMIPPRRKRAGRLGVEESDRLYRFARVLAHAMSVIGNIERASEWMLTPNRALGGVKPLDLMDTEAGAEEIDEVLGRLEYGIFS